MQVMLDDILFDVEVEKKNNKNIYFRFKDDILHVSCNRFVTNKQIEKLIYDNKDSLMRMYKKVKKKENNNIGFNYLGKRKVIVYDNSINNTYIDDDIIYTKDDTSFNKWYKNECLKVFQDRIDSLLYLFDNIPKFSLRIRKMSSRWGVNNVTKKIITLNSELLKKDVALIDYVIVHELCHFYEGNHSDRFWYQVGLRYPEYKLARKKLREE